MHNNKNTHTPRCRQKAKQQKDSLDKVTKENNLITAQKAKQLKDSLDKIAKENDLVVKKNKETEIANKAKLAAVPVL